MKKIYPCSALTIILEIFFLAICLLCIFGFCLGIMENNLYGYLCSISSIIVFLGSLIYFLSFIKKRITITEKEIIVSEDIADKRNIFLRKIQYNTSVSFDEIEKIYICSTNKDSRGQHVKFIFVFMPYIVFECKDRQKKMINVYYFSKKQVIYIIDEVKRRALLVGNDFQIETGEELISKIIDETKD